MICGNCIGLICGVAGWGSGVFWELIIKSLQFCYHGVVETGIGTIACGGGMGMCGWCGGAMLNMSIKIPQFCYHTLIETFIGVLGLGGGCGVCGWCGGATLEMLIKAFSALWLFFI